jgi:hypothetical protein
MARYDIKKKKIDKISAGIKGTFRAPTHAKAALYSRYLQFIILAIQTAILFLIFKEMQ